MASIAHLDFDVAPELVRAFERRALSLLISEANLRHAARASLFGFGSIEKLCEATPLDVLMLDGIGPISAYQLQRALANRGRYLAGVTPFQRERP